MTILGTLLKNKRAGEAQLAWNLPALAGPEVLDLHSSAFEQGRDIPKAHAGKRALDTAKPAAVLAAVSGPALARGRLDGLYTR